ncbi:DUF1638 domain-containing protein [Bacillota bacterium LX-D]|nr:DUF1638 domain-containing protein [Bacillota bacterium LX-D]
MNNTKLIACRTLEDEINAIKPQNIDCEFLEYALHNTPDVLKNKLTDAIIQDKDHDTLLLGYGLCSNSTAGLKSDRHTIVIPKVHDCISLLLGSRTKYHQEFDRFPATYYLSKGWIKQKGDPLSSYKRYCEKYGEENAKYVMDVEYANYQRVAYIHTLGNDADDVEYSKEVAKFLKVEFVEIEGSLRIFEKLLNAEWDKEFIINRPGMIISASSFV